MIGQPKAKKVLSVAMYNHYKRINHIITSTKLAMEEKEDEMAMDESFYSETVDNGNFMAVPANQLSIYYFLFTRQCQWRFSPSYVCSERRWRGIRET